MKRRKAIGTILLAGGATAVGFAGYEWYELAKSPDRNYLFSKKSLLADLAETIIPATDTPGAKEAGAVEYMMHLLNECTDTKTLNQFVEGLQDLEFYTSKQFNRTFTDCHDHEKQAVLTHFSNKSGTGFTFLEKVKNKVTGKSFFETLKSYTVQGYCISEKGASLGMRYIAVPGKWLACIPLEPNQKAWATK
ncbi:MAG TPA: gluconate 2-dehydrogenase subunit 3 family protein [Puia sp.]